MNQKDTLRTLKDFIDDIKTHNVSDEWKRQRYLTLKMLRREAIKWIKEFEKQIKEHPHKESINPLELLKNCINCRNKYVQSGWIKHFFNITDEDLK